MTFFESIKQSVSIPQVAACYGMTVDRSGKCCCLFHQDKHPSMKLNEDYYYCFSCQATGDVISLTARLFDLTTKDAALKLASDFWFDTQCNLAATFCRKSSPPFCT